MGSMAKLSWLSSAVVIVLIIGARADAFTVPALYVFGDSLWIAGSTTISTQYKISEVIDLQKQLYQFLHHRAAVTEKHGQEYAEEKFANAVYLISIGSNDYLGGYFGNPQQREKFTPERFVHAIVTGVVEGIKGLLSSFWAATHGLPICSSSFGGDRQLLGARSSTGSWTQ